jgi:hypothetical protein
MDWEPLCDRYFLSGVGPMHLLWLLLIYLCLPALVVVVQSNSSFDKLHGTLPAHSASWYVYVVGHRHVALMWAQIVLERGGWAYGTLNGYLLQFDTVCGRLAHGATASFERD